MKTVCCCLGILCALPASTFGAEVFEVTRERVDELPGGKEADGIIGDFVLRNDLVEAVISQNAPLRRANMSTFYGKDGETPGCLYDLTLRGADNDQITILAPLGQKGKVSWVRIIPADELAANEAGVETVLTAGKGGGLAKRYRYIVTDGVQGVTILTTLENSGDKAVEIKMQDKWTGLARANYAHGFLWGDAGDPADKAGYALTWVKSHGVGRTPKGEESLEPGGSLTVSRFLAVGTSPMDAVRVAASRREGDWVEGRLVVKGAGGTGVPEGEIAIEVGDGKTLLGYPDDKNEVPFALPPGSYSFRAEDRGRGIKEGEINLEKGVTARIEVEMGPRSHAVFHITDEGGKLIPCKAMFAGRGGTENPRLGPQNRAHGCRDQWHSESGEFRVPLVPGKYTVTVTRGPEFSHLMREIEVEEGKDVDVRGSLKRLVESGGWVSTDFHNHSTPSGDNTCGTDDRVINLAAEHIEFAPTTEHNRIYDWKPHIERLGLADELATVPGMELTGPAGHLNSFPLKPVPFTQDGGAPVWEPDTRVNALHLREHQGGDPDRWVHLNHPRMDVEFFDKNGDGIEDGGFAFLGGMLDGLETENYATQFRYGGGILGGAPYRIQTKPESFADKVRINRAVTWLQMLNRGERVWGIAVADAHSVWGNGVGGWRTYVRSSKDAPGEIDWREIAREARKGRMVLTTGPFLEVTADDGALPGDSIEKQGGKVSLSVKVQCTDWLDIDRVQVLVNGRQRPDLNFTRKSHPGHFADGVVKFEQEIEVTMKEDSHLIVVAIGENFDLTTGFGTSAQGTMQPCAYNNPIFVDVDGGGFTPNGDLLDHPVPVKGMSVERVREILKNAK